MKQIKNLLIGALAITILTTSCKNMNKTQKGAVIGTAGGGAVGAVIGKAAGNTALGAIIGATVGGVTGAVIGRKMDKQAEEIKNEVPGAKVERVGEGIVVEFSSAVLFGFDQSNISSTALSKSPIVCAVSDEAPCLSKKPITSSGLISEAGPI